MTEVADRPPTDAEIAQFRALLTGWMVRCKVALSAYNDAATRTLAAERRLGVPAVALSAIVATSVFAALEESESIRLVTGMLAVGAAVLTALQTFLRQQERAEQFLEAARSYGRIRRELERSIRFSPSTKTGLDLLIEELETALGEAARGKPNVPQVVWDRAEYKVKGYCDARGLRAVRLRLYEWLDFGLSQETHDLPPEDHARYFSGLESATLTPLDALVPSKLPGDQQRSIAVARRRMGEAAIGSRPRRGPLDVVLRDDGTMVVIDGNATLAVARDAGWHAIPIRLRANETEKPPSTGGLLCG